MCFNLLNGHHMVRRNLKWKYIQHLSSRNTKQMQIVTKAFGMRNRLFVAAAFEIILSRESDLRWKNWSLFLLLVAIFTRQEQYRPGSFVSVVSNRFEEANKIISIVRSLHRHSHEMVRTRIRLNLHEFCGSTNELNRT